MKWNELWFADADLRQELSEASSKAHSEYKFEVGTLEEEVQWICPRNGGSSSSSSSSVAPPPAQKQPALAVMRLTDTHFLGFGEADIDSRYQQLARLLHQDKHQDSPIVAAAFRRLEEAGDELREMVSGTRTALAELLEITGNQTPVDHHQKRPQLALLAEVSRLCSALLSACGEGQSPHEAWKRASISRQQGKALYGPRNIEDLLSAFEGSCELLEKMTSEAVRSAFDCAPRQLSSIFLSLLRRLMASQASRCSGVVADAWNRVLARFPELSLWQSIIEAMRRLLAEGAISKSKENHRETWRTELKALLPLHTSAEGGMPFHDCPLEEFAIKVWRELAKTLEEDTSLTRALILLESPDLEVCPCSTAEDTRSDSGLGKWAFVPVVDILLGLGEDFVGISVLGVYQLAPEGSRPSRPLKRPENRFLAEPPPEQQAAALKATTREAARGNSSKEAGMDATKSSKQDERTTAQQDTEARKGEEDGEAEAEAGSAGAAKAAATADDTPHIRPSSSSSSSSPSAKTSVPPSPPGMRAFRDFPRSPLPEVWRHDRFQGKVTEGSSAAVSRVPEQEDLDEEQVAIAEAFGGDSDIVEVVDNTAEGSDWPCPVCTFGNHALMEICEMCETPREKKARASNPRPARPAPRQWNCAACGSKNHPDLQQCATCDVGRGAKA
eukprot:CAMPEP_0206627244 /NCGR_PEP_ID=MMETSP0325_2-20121206/65821_1 /ASSEMBLY_ACC=CAM_ASM_000347 /TAXON_ID=2866 /ORGANISM="Crypthecodinium cohnii, Strain Seligo" /LENGTH=670 /DNA_ID=CAMNT_0054151793 /DNA_START=75 /DNA_END=2083 /DNA_ORIENTATION=+